MMRSKRILALALGLVALFLVDWVTRPSSVETREALPLFRPWTSESVHAVRVEDRGGKTGSIEQGKPGEPETSQVLIAERDADGVYRLTNAFGFPARPAVVENLLGGLAGMTTLDLLSEDPNSHAGYGLRDDQAVRVTLTNKTGRVLADLLQGDSAPGGRASFVRRFGEDAVYRAPRFRQRVRAELAPWWDGRWMPIDPAMIQRIRIDGLGGEPLELSLLAGSRLKWEDQSGQTRSSIKVKRFLRALAGVSIQEVVGAGAPPDPSSLSFEVEQAGGQVWKGWLSVANEESAQESDRAPGSVERNGLYQLHLAPKACEAVRKSLADL